MGSTISNIIESLSDILVKMYPEATVYDGKTSQRFSVPAFYIQLADWQYSKRIHNKYNAVASFDLAYFSDKKMEIETDCHMVAETLLRKLGVIGTKTKFRITGKQTSMTDDVLHVMFDVKYSEINPAEVLPLQSMDLVSGLKEE